MGFNISKRSFLKGLLASPLAAKASFWDNRRHKDEEQLAGDNKLRICFGSCNRQGRSQAYWSKIATTEPNAWFWLGDNIYGDTENPPVLAARYGSMLRGNYGNFRSQFRVEGIWDDHDYGLDGSNRAHPQKEKSQELFLDFLQADPSDERRNREGIYYCRTFGVGTKEVKVFFLDCRYFKDPEKGSGATLLGSAQWQWLEEEMASSRAQVNIIVSPIGFLLNRLFVTEDWAEYPRERSRLLDLIGKYDLQGTFFLSGDKHFGAAIKKRAPRSGRGRVSYFEFQSSGLTHNNGEERLRIIRSFYGRRNIIGTKNFGQIDFEEKKGQLHMSWTLHSLDNDQLKLKREFQLKKNLWVLS
jgi:alkaline phosphatase D